MVRMYSRRKVLAGSAGVTASAVGMVMLPPGEAGATSGSGGSIGQVVGVTGSMLEVELDSGARATVPAVGFPAGWQLRPGDGVLVMNSHAAGTPDHAIPLVTPISGEFREDSEAQVSIADTQVRVRDETIQLGDGAHADAFCVSNQQESSLTAVAIRLSH